MFKLHPCYHPSHIMWWYIWKVTINISFFYLYILCCNQLPVTNYIIAALQMGHHMVRIGWQQKGGDNGTFTYLIRTHLFISHISCSKVVCSWAHPTELQRVTDLEMITKALVDDQLTAFKRLWKDICKVTKVDQWISVKPKISFSGRKLFYILNCKQDLCKEMLPVCTQEKQKELWKTCCDHYGVCASCHGETLVHRWKPTANYM